VIAGEDLELFERSLRAATDTNDGATLDAALAELGWSDALDDDPRAAIATLFTLQGGATVTSSALDLVVADALGVTSSTSTSAVVLPAMARCEPPGSVDADGLHVDGLAVAALADRPAAIVVATVDGMPRSFAVPTDSLEIAPVGGVDPSPGLVQVTGRSLPASDGTPLGPDAWPSAIARGQVALAHELVGTSRTMLALAREHALERIQFGRPISSFQAIRHRLAETLVAIETAEAVIDLAWLDGTTRSAAMAKASAGRNARTAVRHCQQVLAGIGFTTEHRLHLSIRRTLLLDALLGTSTSLTRALGEELIASRALPPLLPL
jgi:hypothetical protein